MSVTYCSLRDARLLQAVAVEQGIERAAGALECRIARDRGPHLFVAHDQAELLDGVVEHGALDDLLQRPHMQAVAQRLLGLGPLAGLALDPSSWRLNWSRTWLTVTEVPPTQP